MSNEHYITGEELLFHIRSRADLSVETLNQRNAIQAWRRRWGMTVGVWNEATPANNGIYLLKRGLASEQIMDNGNWDKILTGSDSGSIIDITYADLVTAIGASELIAGQKYRIADFRTVHYMMDGFMPIGNINEGDIEPLIVLATSTNEINKRAYSEQYPQDEIWYDWNEANWLYKFGYSSALVKASVSVNVDAVGPNPITTYYKIWAVKGGDLDFTVCGEVEVITGDSTTIAEVSVTPDLDIGGGGYDGVYLFKGTESGVYTEMALGLGSTISLLDPISPVDWYTIPETFIVEKAYSSVINEAFEFRIVDGWKGCIFMRYDKIKNIKTPFDFRNVKNRRWACVDDRFDDTDEYYTKYQMFSRVWERTHGIIYGEYFDYEDFYTFEINLEEQFEPSNVIIEDVAGYGDILGIPNIVFFANANDIYYKSVALLSANGDQASSYGVVGECIVGWGGNNDINEMNGCLMGGGFSYNKILTISTVTAKSGFSFNELGRFDFAEIGNGFFQNKISGHSHDNVIGDGFQSNSIGDGFRWNTIGDDFERNTIGAEFNFNKIGNSFSQNTIGSSFHSNTGATTSVPTGESFLRNTIGSFFSNNKIGSYFWQNTIGSYCSGDAFKTNFMNNSIGSHMEGCTFGEYVRKNTFHDWIRYVTTPDGTDTDPFQQNEFSSGVESISFAGATHVFLPYNCTIYVRPDGEKKLRYYNNSDELIIVNATD